jgi:DNA-binding NarL/FixJ family response regulator
MSASNLAISIDSEVPHAAEADAVAMVDRRRVTAAVAVIGPLSPREGQVLGLIDGGMTSKEVAFELGVSDATVRVLISRALRKLGRPRRRRR